MLQHGVAGQAHEGLHWRLREARNVEAQLAAVVPASWRVSEWAQRSPQADLEHRVMKISLCARLSRVPAEWHDVVTLVVAVASEVAVPAHAADGMHVWVRSHLT